MKSIDNEIGFKIHKLDIDMKRMLDARMKADGYDDVTLSHGWILRYLYDNRDRDVYQRDIEKFFSMNRSTVTTIIQLMEKRDLVRREYVESDARLKKVVLTEKGHLHHHQVEKNIDAMHQKILIGVSEEEKQIFLNIINRMFANMIED